MFDWIKDTDKQTYTIKGLILANQDTKDNRRNICNDCESRKAFLCGECGCIIRAKSAIANEKCPIGKW